METQEFGKQTKTDLRNDVTMLDTMFLLLSGFVKQSSVCVCVKAFQFNNVCNIQACKYCYKAR